MSIAPRPWNEKHAVRCCNNNELTCMSPRPCQLSQTFEEAKNICGQQGLSLCSNNEILDDICCQTGCEIDTETMWIADYEPRNIILILYTSFLFDIKHRINKLSKNPCRPSYLNLLDKCTPGYIFRAGDINGWGFGVTREASVEKCAKRCDNTVGCNSYQYSNSEPGNNCAIHNGGESQIGGNTYLDFYMCYKSGTDFIFRLFTTQIHLMQ